MTWKRALAAVTTPTPWMGLAVSFLEMLEQWQIGSQSGSQSNCDCLFLGSGGTYNSQSYETSNGSSLNRGIVMRCLFFLSENLHGCEVMIAVVNVQLDVLIAIVGLLRVMVVSQ